MQRQWLWMSISFVMLLEVIEREERATMIKLKELFYKKKVVRSESLINNRDVKLYCGVMILQFSNWILLPFMIIITISAARDSCLLLSITSLSCGSCRLRVMTLCKSILDEQGEKQIREMCKVIFSSHTHSSLSSKPLLTIEGNPDASVAGVPRFPFVAWNPVETDIFVMVGSPRDVFLIDTRILVKQIEDPAEGIVLKEAETELEHIDGILRTELSEQVSFFFVLNSSVLISS